MVSVFYLFFLNNFQTQMLVTTYQVVEYGEHDSSSAGSDTDITECVELFIKRNCCNGMFIVTCQAEFKCNVTHMHEDGKHELSL
jgi:hypothetical protein